MAQRPMLLPQPSGSLEIKYCTVFAATKSRSQPAVVGTLGLPGFAELAFIDFVL